MRIARMAGCFVAAAACATASAANWEMIDDSDRAVVYVDKSSIVTKGNTRKAWFLSDYLEEMYTDGYSKKKYRSAKVLTHFNCAERTLGPSQSVLYSDAMGKGEVVSSAEIDASKVFFSDVVPDSLGEAKLERVCRPSKSK